LSLLRRILQRRGVNMDHDLVPFARGAGVQLLMQRRLRQ
jgi:hypothetical protein